MYNKEHGLYVAHCENGPLSIVGKMANRHGLVAGATGTGKTVTLQVIAESFCQAGVPCFMADMKGDLSGISQAGKMSGFIEKRLPEFGLEAPEFQACPVRFFDVYGEQGHPMRATISQMGPQLLSRLLGLNETQDGVLNITFRIADERGLLLTDLKDLRAMLDFVSKHAKEYTTKYGNISSATVGAIQRALLQLENQGADKFFGEPSFDIMDLLQQEGGKGVMNVLAADRLMMQPKLYSTFLLWLLSDLYSRLPEVGDMELPKLIFFFDEAHMLFEDTSKALTDKIEQVIRLIRSKGVGIYFVTQSPTDIPENILGQLGNRVQHALRAYTPKDQRAVKTAADTFRPNPAFKTDEAIMNLETGEALVSFLDEKGAPNVVERAKILFPLSQIGAISEGQRLDIIKQSRIYGKYDTPVDNVSAYEQLQESGPLPTSPIEEENEPSGSPAGKPSKSEKKKPGLLSKVLKAVVTAVTATLASVLGTVVSDAVTGKKTKSRTSTTGRVAKNATSAATRTITRELTRDILGNLTKVIVPCLMFATTATAASFTPKADRTYYITNTRGDWGTKDGFLTSTANASAAGKKGEFAFVTYDEKMYLYSVADKKFMYRDKTPYRDTWCNVVLSNEIIEPIEITVTGTTGTPYYLTSGDYVFNTYSGTQKGVCLSQWTKQDAGNQYKIEEVADFDATEALATLSMHSARMRQ